MRLFRCPQTELIRSDCHFAGAVTVVGLLLWQCKLMWKSLCEPVCTTWHNYSLPASVPGGLFTQEKHAIISCDASRGVRHFTRGGAPPLRNPARNLFVTWTSQINTWPTFLITSGQQWKMFWLSAVVDFVLLPWTILFLRKSNKYPFTLTSTWCTSLDYFILFLPVYW